MSVYVRYRDYAHDSIVSSLYRQVIAKSKVKMLETIERLLAFETVELCYTNVDSIHLSIDRSQLNSFLETNKDLIGEGLGQLKIQTFADNGHWFDIGRYWLRSMADEVLMYRNIGIRRLHDKKPYKANSKYPILVPTPFGYERDHKWYNFLSKINYLKKITKSSDDNYYYCRYNLSEVLDPSVAGRSVESEKSKSQKTMINEFNSMAT